MATIIRTCPEASPCLPDGPLDNFSSEADDTLDYISTRFAGTPPPPLLHNWIGTACESTYISNISQLDADLHAAALAATCVNNTPDLPIFLNAPQTCCVPCPDGTSTCYQVPGGLFPAFNQASADSLAHLVACDLVNKNKVCLGSIPGCTCVGTPYGAIITSSTPATITFFAGSLPPGVTFSASSTQAALLGVPTLLGTYTFQIKAQTPDGPYMIKTFSITVLQIVTSSLPSFTVGTPYSFQLQVAGGSGNYAWKITSGTLPAGITLSLSGLLSGTPTASGTNPLQFEAIDQTCESTDQSFFPPSVALTTRSTTQIATVLGFDEYPGFTSTPPKRYHTLTWSGTSEQQLWFPANTIGNSGPAYQVAGARFDYSGSSTIDGQGNYTSLYTKDLSEMCNVTNDNLVTSFVQGFNGGLLEYIFSGWFGPTGHTKCPPTGIPYSFVSNQAIGKGQLASQDSSGFWGSKSLPQSNVKVSDFNALSATQGLCVDSGGSPNTPAIIALFEPVPSGTPLTIDNTTQGTIWFFAGIVWTHDYDSALSNEYTDAEALANAQIILGNGAVAQNNPRTTGFVSQFTNVVFTLTATDLITATNYTISVDLVDLTSGTTTTKQYSVVGGSAASITDIIPTPAPGHLIQVRNPRITFA